jgi:hypothetical protein
MEPTGLTIAWKRCFMPGGKGCSATVGSSCRVDLGGATIFSDSDDMHFSGSE